jgi:hypothetical protein
MAGTNQVKFGHDGSVESKVLDAPCSGASG